ncbi:mitochondrial protein import protein MAS5 (MAS5) [Vairimorpha necatrix]|uniref:Mitochondrial protein import protein MAS5 (MAS5) n=1 Tax=Vairimorpha necatrix TaxID=6039 RepID=A0AAX4JB08_9MICR
MAHDPEGLYAVLGLQAGASIEEVKKAFTKKQRECHPDGPQFKAALRKCKTDEEKAKVEKEFKEKSSKCNQAKAVLFDEKKKQQYDMGITGDFSFGEGASDIFDIFSQFTGGSRRNQVHKVQDIEYEFNVSFQESFMGKVSSFNVKVQRECGKCHGKGGDNVETCNTCKGKGKVEHHRRLGPLITVQESECHTCRGTGQVIKGKVCQECAGSQYAQTNENISVKVEPGVKNGRKYVFTGRGNHKKGCVPGDIVLIASITKDPKFKRVGNHVYCKIDIPLYTALTGGQILFDHVNGKKLQISVNPFKDLKKCIIVKGEGFKIENSNSYGDLILDPNIVIDRHINKDKLADALNFIPAQINNPASIKKQSEFGTMPSEQEQRENYESEDFMGGGARDFFGKFSGFF